MVTKSSNNNQYHDKTWGYLRYEIKIFLGLPLDFHLPPIVNYFIDKLEKVRLFHLVIAFLEKRISVSQQPKTQDIFPTSKKKILGVIVYNKTFCLIIGTTFWLILSILAIIAYPTSQYASLSDAYKINDFWGRGYSYSLEVDGVINQHKYIPKTPYKQSTASIVFPEVKLDDQRFFLYKFVPKQIEVEGQKYFAHYDGNNGLYLAKELRYLDIVLPTLIFEYDNQWLNFDAKEMYKTYVDKSYYTKRKCSEKYQFAKCKGVVENFEYEIIPDLQTNRFLFRTTVYFNKTISNVKNVISQINIPQKYKVFYKEKEIAMDNYDSDEFLQKDFPVHFLNFLGSIEKSTYLRDIDINSYDLTTLFLPFNLEIRKNIPQYKDIIPTVNGLEQVKLQKKGFGEIILDFNSNKVKKVQLDQSYDLITVESKDCYQKKCTVEFFMSII